LYYPSRREVGVARIRSIDLLRGCDVLLMLFVNEVADLRGAPAILLHAGPADDGMTVADAVFPTFLFLVGMAIPFALASRLGRGETRLAVLRHVLQRSLALVVVGVLMVNAEYAVPGWLSLPAWNVLMTLGVLLVWAVPRAGWGERHWKWLRAVGVLLLVLLALVYRGRDVSGFLQLRPYWWGILGLIGWAYLGVASLYVWVGERPAVLVGLLGVYGCVALADAGSGFRWAIGEPLVGAVVGTHGAVVLAGCLLGVLVARHARQRAPAWRLAAQALALAAALAAAGLLLHGRHELHRAFAISKIDATLPWGLLSAAFACAAWVVVFVTVDALGHGRWPRSFVIAGENPLLAYLLAPLVLTLFGLWDMAFDVNPYEALRESLALGLLVSAGFAWLVARVTGWLRAAGLRFQL
jgi:heparan-alpha-glucosaminide N-acetyltransferase